MRNMLSAIDYLHVFTLTLNVNIFIKYLMISNYISKTKILTTFGSNFKYLLVIIYICFAIIISSFKY